MLLTDSKLALLLVCACVCVRMHNVYMLMALVGGVAQWLGCQSLEIGLSLLCARYVVDR